MSKSIRHNIKIIGAIFGFITFIIIISSYWNKGSVTEDIYLMLKEIDYNNVTEIKIMTKQDTFIYNDLIKIKGFLDSLNDLKIYDIHQKVGIFTFHIFIKTNTNTFRLYCVIKDCETNDVIIAYSNKTTLKDFKSSKLLEWLVEENIFKCK